LLPTDKQRSWNAVTPKAQLEYHTDGGSLVYGGVTRGFKSGVINIGSMNSVINPEYVTSYEVGFKTTSADKKVFTGLSVFYYNYKDLQVGFVNADSTVETRNAAKARNYGIEYETHAKLTSALTGDLAVTYLNAKYLDFVNNYYRTGFSTVQLAGNTLSNAPEFSGHVGLTYRAPVAGGELSLHGEAVYSDKVYFTEWNNADAYQPAYTLMNFHASYEMSNHTTITAWVRNAGDKLITANNIITAPLYLSSRVGTLMPPRTIGLTLGYSF